MHEEYLKFDLVDDLTYSEKNVAIAEQIEFSWHAINAASKGVGLIMNAECILCSICREIEYIMSVYLDARLIVIRPKLLEALF
jgi:hypothetical protein